MRRRALSALDGITPEKLNLAATLVKRVKNGIGNHPRHERDRRRPDDRALSDGCARAANVKVTRLAWRARRRRLTIDDGALRRPFKAAARSNSTLRI
jgi:hypothetical protein